MDNFYNKQPLELKDSDFYPPSDNRTFHMYHDEEFLEYTEYIYDLYESEGFYED